VVLVYNIVGFAAFLLIISTGIDHLCNYLALLGAVKKFWGI
jgi:hypothetical protein